MEYEILLSSEMISLPLHQVGNLEHCFTALVFPTTDHMWFMRRKQEIFFKQQTKSSATGCPLS
jgi:hypothetical protein